MRAIAIVLCATAVARADPTPDQKKRADKLFEDGRRYLAQKEYALACTAFEQSQESDPAIGTVLNIALCYEQWQHVAAAYRAYVEAERLAKVRFDPRAKGARNKIDELGPKVPHLIIDLPADADPAAVFLLDAKELDRAALAGDLLVETGAHTVEARVPGKPPIVTTTELHQGEHKHVRIDVPRPAPIGPLPPPPRRKGRLYGGIALASGGAVAIAIAGGVALKAQSDYNNAIVRCLNLSCSFHADYVTTQNAIHTASAMTFVAAGGFALAGVGVVLIVTSRGKRSEPRVSVTPLLAPGTAGIAIGGSL